MLKSQNDALETALARLVNTEPRDITIMTRKGPLLTLKGDFYDLSKVLEEARNAITEKIDRVLTEIGEYGVDLG
jgi:hypothetical protein